MPAHEDGQKLCGVAGGLGKVVTGHPFDTVKSRVQSGAFANSRQALSETFRKEGVAAFYQGVLPPCVSVGIVSGMLFYVNGRIRSARRGKARDGCRGVARKLTM